jgi:hypothetical protein
MRPRKVSRRWSTSRLHAPVFTTLVYNRQRAMHAPRGELAPEDERWIAEMSEGRGKAC